MTAAERVDRTSFEHLRRLTRRHSRKATLLIVLVVLIVVFSLLSSDFLTSSNLLSTARRGVEIGLISMAMAVVIGSGGIDLSVGSIVALSSVTIGYSHAHGMPLVASLVLGFGVAAACGAFNGLLIATLGLHPLVVTIGTLALYSGLALGISSGGGYSQFPDWFQNFGQSYFGIFPGQLYRPGRARGAHPHRRRPARSGDATFSRSARAGKRRTSAACGCVQSRCRSTRSAE